MTKTIKIIWSILAVVAVAVVATLAVLIVGKNNTQTATSVMECSINPNIQFVLDQNSKVMTVNCLNNDAEVLLSTDVTADDFKNLTAEDAASLLTKLATEAGYINANISSAKDDGIKTVTITFYTQEGKDISELKTKVQEKVNAYFDENGIISGTITQQVESFEKVLSNISADVSNYAELSVEEVLKLVDEQSKNVQGIATSLYTSVAEKIEALKSTLNFSTLEKQLSEYQEKIDDYSAQLEKMGSAIDETTKQLIQSQLDIAKQQLASAQKMLKEKQAELNTQLDAFLEQLKEQSKTIFEQAKETLKTRLDTYKSVLENHKAEFEKNKDAINEQISAFRAELYKTQNA